MFNKISNLTYEIVDDDKIKKEVEEWINGLTITSSSLFIRESNEALFDLILSRIITSKYMEDQLTPRLKKGDVIKIYIKIEKPRVVTISILDTDIKDIFYNINYL